MTTPAATTVRSTCHCGAITVTAPRLPKYINVCQCTICRRYGAAWGYYDLDEVKVDKRPGAATKEYIWGDRDNAFHFCDHCGCVVFWWPIREPTADGKHTSMGLNANNVQPDVLKYVDRTYEYAQLLAPVRDRSYAHPDDPATY